MEKNKYRYKYKAKIIHVERAEVLTADDLKPLKGRFRHAGHFLRNPIGIFRRKYEEEDIALETIGETSKIINRIERKLGNYLSKIIRNERIDERYKRVLYVKKKQEEMLSMAITKWLQMYNPQIMEITSYSRAKCIAESLEHLFENEWQEMLDASRSKIVSRVPDRVIIECLRDALKYCYQCGKDFARKQSELLLGCITMSTQYNIDTCQPVIRLRIKDLQKEGVPNTLPFIKRIISKTIVSQVNLRTVVKAHRTQTPPFRTFLDLCTEVTWLMQFQDPPIALDFTEGNNSMKFKPNTTSGREFGFVVWPAMLLHENGPIVSKGIAKFFDPGSDGTLLMDLS